MNHYQLFRIMVDIRKLYNHLLLPDAPRPAAIAAYYHPLGARRSAPCTTRKGMSKKRLRSRKNEDFGKYDDLMAWKFAEEGKNYWSAKIEELKRVL